MSPARHRIAALLILILLGVFVGATCVAAGEVTKPTAPAKKPAAKTTAKKAIVAKKPTARKRTVVRRRTPARQSGPARSRIIEIQNALASAGAYSKTPNGKWDTATKEAMTQFQSANGLAPTGKINALTLQKLGLGSEVAGRAAPLPPTGDAALSADSAPSTP